MESTITVSNRATAPAAMPVKAVFTNSIWTETCSRICDVRTEQKTNYG